MNILSVWVMLIFWDGRITEVSYRFSSHASCVIEAEKVREAFPKLGVRPAVVCLEVVP